MAANDNKRYYWFKCDHTFFEDYRMRALQNASSATINIDEADPFVKRALVNMSIGYIYIRLLAESCTHDGILKFDANTSYDFEVLADTLGCPVDMLNAAFIKLKQLKLVEIDNDGIIILNELNKFIGSETGSSMRKKEFREGTIGRQSGDKRGTSRGQSGDKRGTSRGQAGDKQGTNGVKCPLETRDKSIEYRDKRLENKGVVIERGVGETTQEFSSDESSKLRFPKSRLLKIVTLERVGDVLRKNEIEPFINYVIERGFCEREANQSVTTSYIKCLARSWKREGHADSNLHQITREELKAIVADLNPNRDLKITETMESRFWDFLASRKFQHKNGELVTKYTAGELIGKWVDLDTREQRNAAEEAEREQQLEERRNRIRMSKVRPEDEI